MFSVNGTLRKISSFCLQVKGYDFNQGVDHHALLQSYKFSGFQATNFGLAVEEINKMIIKRLEITLKP